MLTRVTNFSKALIPLRVNLIPLLCMVTYDLKDLPRKMCM